MNLTFSGVHHTNKENTSQIVGHLHIHSFLISHTPTILDLLHVLWVFESFSEVTSFEETFSGDTF